MLRSESKLYNSLYDWQKPFIDKLVDKFDLEKHTSKHTRYGFFLRMGIGKTKLMLTMGELHESDCIIVTSILPKVLEENIRGSFGEELELAGYKVYYSHKLYQPTPLKNGSKRSGNSEPAIAERYYDEFIDDFLNKRKIAYVNNYDDIMTTKGFSILHLLAGGNAGSNKNDKKENVLGYNNITWIFDESHKMKSKESKVSIRVHSMLSSNHAPGLKVIRENYFKENIKHIYLGTGTPFTVGYVDLYQQLRILGHEWAYNDFFNEYCVEDMKIRKFNIYAKAIKDYKNVDKLLDIVDKYAFFARTENYYPFLPERITSVLWCKQDESYKLMAWNSKLNPYYRVFDNYICDTPSIFKLRLRQLASGFMGNADEAKYYSTHKLDKLTQLLEDNDENYLIFYNYTPELFMIMSVAEELGYVYDTYNGLTKEMNYYNDPNRKTKKLILANIKSGSVGLNLQEYKNAIFYSLPDVWSDFEQGVGRIERTGQKSNFVNVYVMMSVNTVESRIWDSLMKGKDYTDKMFERDYIYKEDIK